jgi:anti-anti-sigma factor
VPDEQPDPASFDVTVDVRAGRIHLVLVGGFDHTGTTRFTSVLSDERSFLLPVTIDLGGVSFMDSAGLRCLRYADQWATEDSVGRIQLAGVSASIRPVFAAGDMGVRFDIV